MQIPVQTRCRMSEWGPAATTISTRRQPSVAATGIVLSCGEYDPTWNPGLERRNMLEIDSHCIRAEPSQSSLWIDYLVSTRIQTHTHSHDYFAVDNGINDCIFARERNHPDIKHNLDDNQCNNRGHEHKSTKRNS